MYESTQVQIRWHYGEFKYNVEFLEWKWTQLKSCMTEADMARSVVPPNGLVTYAWLLKFIWMIAFTWAKQVLPPEDSLQCSSVLHCILNSAPIKIVIQDYPLMRSKLYLNNCWFLYIDNGAFIVHFACCFQALDLLHFIQVCDFKFYSHGSCSIGSDPNEFFLDLTPLDIIPARAFRSYSVDLISLRLLFSLIRNLMYCEVPLRFCVSSRWFNSRSLKMLFPFRVWRRFLRTSFLKWTTIRLVAPLSDSCDELSKYRVGVTLDKRSANGSAYANCGLDRNIEQEQVES